jgi:hypothetical protein
MRWRILAAIALVALLAGIVVAKAQARTMIVGDSLAVGMSPYLKARLPGRVDVDARVGRPLREGMWRLDSLGRVRVLVVSLFTNDDPHNTADLRRAIANAKGHADCVVWGTVSRPPVGGKSYEAANRIIRRNTHEVRWARYVQRHPGVLGTDRVHPGPSGYRQLAKLYRAAVRTCA